MNRHLTLLLSGNDRTEVNRHSLGFFRKTLCFYSVFLPEVTVLLQESVIPARYSWVGTWFGFFDHSIREEGFKRKFLPWSSGVLNKNHEKKCRGPEKFIRCSPKRNGACIQTQRIHHVFPISRKAGFEERIYPSGFSILSNPGRVETENLPHIGSRVHRNCREKRNYHKSLRYCLHLLP